MTGKEIGLLLEAAKGLDAKQKQAIGGLTYLANRRRLRNPMDVAQRTAQQQLLGAAQLEQQLGDRPTMEAQVNRLKGLYDLAQKGLPEEVMSAARQDIEQTQSQSLRDLSSRTSGIRGVGTVQENTNRALRDLNAQDAQMAMQNTMNIGSQLAMAEAEAEAYNKLSPYEQMFNQIQGLVGASLQNQMGAANMGADLASSNIGMASQLSAGAYAQGSMSQDALMGAMQGIPQQQPPAQPPIQSLPQNGSLQGNSNAGLNVDTSAFSTPFQGAGFSGGY